MKALIGFAGFGGPEIALREPGIETVGIGNALPLAVYRAILRSLDLI